MKRTFVPSLRIDMLGSWTTPELAHREWLTAVLDELSGETISLAARNGIFAQYIRVIQPTNALRIHVPTGTRRRLVWSAAGFPLLSQSDEEEIAALVRRTNAERRTGPRIRLMQVLANIASFRENGYFFSRGLVPPGGGHIAMRMAIGPGGPQTAYAIGVAGWVERIARNEKRIVRLMRTALRRAG